MWINNPTSKCQMQNYKIKNKNQVHKLQFKSKYL